MRTVVLVSVCLVLLAACGGEDNESTPTQPGEETIGAETPIDSEPAETPGSGRPTISSDELTAFAEITLTVLPTATAAAGSDEPLTVSTVSQHECAPEGDEIGRMNLDQYLANFECIIAYFPWPMDRRIDMDAYRDYFQGSDSGFGPGYQYAGMKTFHTCAWYETWLDAFQTDNDARTAGALDIMLNFIPNYAQLIPGYSVENLGTGANDLKRAEVAALGDPTMIQQYVDQLCGWLPAWQE